MRRKMSHLQSSTDATRLTENGRQRRHFNYARIATEKSTNNNFLLLSTFYRWVSHGANWGRFQCHRRSNSSSSWVNFIICTNDNELCGLGKRMWLRIWFLSRCPKSIELRPLSVCHRVEYSVLSTTAFYSCFVIVDYIRSFVSIDSRRFECALRRIRITVKREKKYTHKNKRQRRNIFRVSFKCCFPVVAVRNKFNDPFSLTFFLCVFRSLVLPASVVCDSVAYTRISPTLSSTSNWFSVLYQRTFSTFKYRQPATAKLLRRRFDFFAFCFSRLFVSLTDMRVNTEMAREFSTMGKWWRSAALTMMAIKFMGFTKSQNECLDVA